MHFSSIYRQFGLHYFTYGLGSCFYAPKSRHKFPNTHTYTHTHSTASQQQTKRPQHIFLPLPSPSPTTATLPASPARCHCCSCSCFVFASVCAGKSFRRRRMFALFFGTFLYDFISYHFFFSLAAYLLDLPICGVLICYPVAAPFFAACSSSSNFSSCAAPCGLHGVGLLPAAVAVAGSIASPSNPLAPLAK